MKPIQVSFLYLEIHRPTSHRWTNIYVCFVLNFICFPASLVTEGHALLRDRSHRCSETEKFAVTSIDTVLFNVNTAIFSVSEQQCENPCRRTQGVNEKKVQQRKCNMNSS